MKKGWKIAAVSLGLLLCLGLGTGLAERKKDKGSIRVAAVIDAGDNVFWENVWNGLREEAEEKNVILTEYPYSDTEQTALLLESNLYTGVDAVIFSIHTEEIQEACESVLNQLKERGIKLIAVDTRPETGAYDAFIGLDNEQAGRETAEEAAAHWTGEEQLVLQDYQNGSLVLQRRIDGCLNRLEELGLSDATDILSISEDGVEQIEALKEYIESAESPPDSDLCGADTYPARSGACGAVWAG